MHKFLINIIYIFFSIIIFALPNKGFAQSLKLKGKVVSQTAMPLANVMISINGSEQTRSNPQGEFEISSTDDKVKFVNAEKEGLVIKDWDCDYIKDNLEIVMARSTTIKGRVFSDKSVPVADVSVLMVGIRGSKPAKTDPSGKFTLIVPEGTQPTHSSFVVFGKPFVNGKANYTSEIISANEVNIFVELPSQIVRKVLVTNPAGEAIPNTTVNIVGVGNFQTDAQGLARVVGQATNYSKYKVVAHRIVSLSYQPEGDQMNIQVASLVGGEDEEENAVSTIDDKKESVEAEKYFLVKAQTETEDEIARTKALLEGDISPEERARLERKLQELEGKLATIRKNTEIARERAEKVIAELQALSAGLGEKEEIIRNKDKTIQEKQAEIAQGKREAKLAQENALKNYIILALIAVALSAILFITYHNSRKTKKQRNELSRANKKLAEVNREVEQSNQKLANLNVKLNDSNEQLKDKIEEVNSQKEMLEASAKMMDRKNSEIRTKNEALTRQKEEIELKNEELEEYNRNITASIRYAQAIQNSILPSRDLIAASLPQHFIFYRPKDIVSGDFYWFSRKGDEIIAVAADCTGHGVPGAFMTMMGNTLLNQIVNEGNLTDPAKILTLLNIRVKETLKQHEQNSERAGDGMDVCLLKINPEKGKAIFAGAKSSLFYCRPEDEEIGYLKGTNMSIGSTLKSGNKTFENHFIELAGGETFYLTSDGFQDQAGLLETEKGTRRSKYLKTRFMNLLFNCAQLPIEQQENRLAEEFDTWKGDMSQTDDVVVFGLKV